MDLLTTSSAAFRSTPGGTSTAATSVSNPDESPSVQFSALEQLSKDIDSVHGNVLYVYGVSPSDYDTLDKARESRIPGSRFYGLRFRRFYPKIKLLIIVIPMGTHEMLHRLMSRMICKEADGMGLGDDWNDLGSTTYRSQERPNAGSGEGDSVGLPSERLEPNNWPTLVIEAGYSQSLQELRDVMRWWFSTSNHEVKIVILGKVDVSQRLITIEKYQEVSTHQRQGATMTRAATAFEPHLNQTIRISQAAGNPQDPSSYIVTRGVLRLEFRLLFLRQPGIGEEDIIIGIDHLQKLASKVWHTLG